jgi:hypothetical protein
MVTKSVTGHYSAFTSGRNHNFSVMRISKKKARPNYALPGGLILVASIVISILSATRVSWNNSSSNDPFAAFLLPPTFSIVSSPEEKDPDIYDVLIIGSGWSGLGAGDALRQKGMDNFEILEAKGVVGGRSHTEYPFTKDLAVELGSAWTYQDTHVHEILLNNNISFGEIHYDLDKTFGLYYQSFQQGRAQEITDDERRRLINKLMREDYIPYAEERTRSLRKSGKDVPYQTILDDFLKHHGYDSNSKERHFLQAMVHSQIQIEYAAPLNEISGSFRYVLAVRKQDITCLSLTR